MKIDRAGMHGSQPGHTDPVKDLQAQVDAAHREWQAAQQYFQMVSEPELVDHAIFTLEAAQRKYMYLFRQVRQSREGSGQPEG
jgi:hypothetical protein